MHKILQAAKDAAPKLAALKEVDRSKLLNLAAKKLLEHKEDILKANELDLKASEHLNEALKDRLRLSSERIESMANGCIKVANQASVLGIIKASRTLSSGIYLEQISVPLGVVGIIYEARPNVSADAFALCIKSGNAVVLKGGSEALNSNAAICAALNEALDEFDLAGALGFINDASRQAAVTLMQASDYLDVLIPRGGAGLINAVKSGAQMSVIATGEGNCHLYVDKAADIKMALKIILNAKLSRPSVCNALETVLVHKACANEIINALKSSDIELLGCKRLAARFDLKEASNWDAEFLAPILRVKEVDDLDAALAHIAQFSSKHSEAIITSDEAAAQAFCARVDAACVYVNASTRFSDGECFGLGAEIGISTQKMHARGPMGASALTSYKYILRGSGEIRE